MAITTRLATQDDAEDIAGLIAVLMASHDLPVPAAEKLVAAAQHILQDERCSTIVAEADNMIVGCVQLLQRYSTWAAAHYGYAEDFVVADAWRSRGVGALLLDHARRLATARGWVRLDLDVTHPSRQASFYQREGFHDTGSALYRLDLDR